MGHTKTDREKRVTQILATDMTREQLADALWCAEDCVHRLVERTSLLNDKISKLRTEFDKMDKWHSAELQAAMAENAKLRELVEDMLDCIEICEAFGRPPTSEIYKEFAQRADELGIEVDE